MVDKTSSDWSKEQCQEKCDEIKPSRISRERLMSNIDLDWGHEDRRQWKEILNELNARYSVMKLLELEYGLREKILNVDIIVEKAHRKLTRRARNYFISGIISTVICVLIAFSFALFLFFPDEVGARFRHLIQMADMPIAGRQEYEFHQEIYTFILVLLRRLTAGGLILGLCYLFAANANSCFRESTIILHRRHALRYVRLALSEGDKVPKNDLRDIFGIDDVTNTGFDRIKIESIRDNLIGKLIDAVAGRGGAFGATSPLLGKKNRKGRENKRKTGSTNDDGQKSYDSGTS